MQSSVLLRKAVVEYYFQIHEIFRTIPLDVYSLLIVVAIDLFEKHSHIFYALFDLIVVIGLVHEGFYGDVKQNHQYKAQQPHENHFFVLK
jgi:hypothetical protein